MAGHRRRVEAGLAGPRGRAHALAAARGGTGTEATLSELVPTRAPATRLAHRSAPATVNVYADDGAGMLAPAARAALPRIYVPNSNSGTVDVINPRTFRVVGHFQ